MKHSDLQHMIDGVGDELGWDEATRAAKLEQLAAIHRRSLDRRAVVHVLPFMRWPSTWDKVTMWQTEPEPESGTTIIDELAGVAYDVCLDGRGRPTYYAVRALAGALSSVVELSRMQVASLAQRFAGSGELVTLQRDAAFRADGKSGERPSVDWLASIIRDAEAAGVSPRATLKRQTGKPWPTVDRWLREARAADPTLPQATRHPRKQRTEGNQP